MVAESVVILAICVLMCGAFIRSRYFKSILAILPVGIIPAVYLIARAVLFIIRKSMQPDFARAVLAFCTVLAVIAACVLFVLLSQKMTRTRVRRFYILVMGIYTLVVGWVYIWYILLPLFNR